MSAGGKRAGAGRPRNDANVLKENKIVLRKLRGGAEAGWEVLADEYPSLIRQAVNLAKGDADNKITPNVSMLKTLLELLPRVVGPDADKENSELTDLLRTLRANTIEADIHIKSTLD